MGCDQIRFPLVSPLTKRYEATAFQQIGLSKDPIRPESGLCGMRSRCVLGGARKNKLHARREDGACLPQFSSCMPFNFHLKSLKMHPACLKSHPTATATRRIDMKVQCCGKKKVVSEKAPCDREVVIAQRGHCAKRWWLTLPQGARHTGIRRAANSDVPVFPCAPSGPTATWTRSVSLSSSGAGAGTGTGGAWKAVVGRGTQKVTDMHVLQKQGREQASKRADRPA